MGRPLLSHTHTHTTHTLRSLARVLLFELRKHHAFSSPFSVALAVHRAFLEDNEFPQISLRPSHHSTFLWGFVIPKIHSR